MKRIAIFCGSNVGNLKIYADACPRMAEALVDRNLGMVYGGGNIGMMGLMANEMIARNAETIGVIPKKLMEKELGHKGITELRVVETMHQRKALISELSIGFIAMPGGIGTLEEIIEVFTWLQLGYHQKPCGLLNVEGYFDKLDEFLKEMVSRQFLLERHKENLIIDDSPQKLLERMFDQDLNFLDKWI